MVEASPIDGAGFPQAGVKQPPIRPLDNFDVIPDPSGLEEPGPDGVEGAVDQEVEILMSPNEPTQRMIDNHCLAGHVPY